MLLNGDMVSSSKQMIIHSYQTRSPLKITKHHQGIINCVNYNHNYRVIASCSEDGTLYLTSSSEPEKIIYKDFFDKSLSNFSINTCAFSPNSLYIAAGLSDSTIKLWEMKNHQDIKFTIKSHIGKITSLCWFNAYNGSHDILASSSNMGEIFLHSAKNASVVYNYSSAASQAINMVRCISQKDCHRLAACTNNGSLMVWDVLNGKSDPSFHFKSSKQISYTALSFSYFHPALMVVSSNDQTLNFFDIVEKKQIKTIKAEEPLTAVNFHSDGHTLVAGGMYGGLYIYDLRAVSKVHSKLVGHQSAVKSIDLVRERKKVPEKQPQPNKNMASKGSYDPKSSQIPNRQAFNPNNNQPTGNQKPINSSQVSNIPSQNSSLIQSRMDELQKDNGSENIDVSPLKNNFIALKKQVSNVQNKPNSSSSIQQQPIQNSRNIRTPNGVITQPNNRPATSAYTTGYQPSTAYQQSTASTHNNSTKQTTAASNITISQKNRVQEQPAEQQSAIEREERAYTDKDIEKLEKRIEMKMCQQFENLQLQIIRQFQIQQQEIKQMLYEANKREIQRQQKIKELEQTIFKLKKSSY